MGRCFTDQRLGTVLVALLVCVASARYSAAKDAWVEVHAPHFTVISNAGDKEARRTADQFEQFREVFRNAFPDLRLDLGRPLVIFAVKNEEGLKLLLPKYWEEKGRARPAGIYASGEERHFVALRTNIEGENPYEVVYHEYAHAILNLNFHDLPVWLGEGLAEYFGNSRIRDSEVDIGIPSPHVLRTLQESRWIPIDELLLVDQQSAYYNEQNRVSIFYAQSWAIVHYLLLDPDARKQNLLKAFLKAREASGDPLAAAREAFGDLKKFSQTMEAYARNANFLMVRVHTSVRGNPKSYSSREISPAELAAWRALFYIHTRRPAEAKLAAEEALQLDPNLSLALEAKGLLAFTQDNFAAAGEAFSRSVESDEGTFSAYYFAAVCMLRAGVRSEAENKQIIGYLEKAIALNPLFAPASANLASVYSMRPDTVDKALHLGHKAVELDPANLQFAISYAHVLLNAGKISEAKTLAVGIQRAAWSPKDKLNAEELLGSIADFEEQTLRTAERAKLAAETSTALPPAAPMAAAGPPSTQTAKKDAQPSRRDDKRTQYMAEGVISTAECNPDSAGRVTLIVGHAAMKFIYSSLTKLAVVEGLTEDSGNAPPCLEWKGRHARLFFYKTKDKPYAGELETVQFF